jgi:hypothetical protein
MNTSAILALPFRLQTMSATAPISFVSPPLGRIEENVLLHPDEAAGTQKRRVFDA